VNYNIKEWQGRKKRKGGEIVQVWVLCGKELKKHQLKT